MFAATGGAVALTERVVIDNLTGLALAGVDPVSYFTDGGPREGRSQFELAHAGTFWRFRSEGNREAFKANPDVYTPGFGGYDPVEAAAGKAVAGKPQLWRIAQGRLYLFYSAGNLAAFEADEARFVVEAAKAWPGVEETLLK